MLNIQDLNPPQKKAVTSTQGPLLILAGAGSGKTRVLTYRIAYILDSGLAGPDNVLALTFTNKAANEMKERIKQLLEKSEIRNFGNLFWMGTFHSVCVKFLRRHANLIGLNSNFSIYDTQDQLSAVKKAMKDANVSTKEFNPSAVRSFISSAKNELIDEVTYMNLASGYFQQVVAEVYPFYQKILRENNAVDFDDLLLLAVKLFEKEPQILEKYQEKFRYILVDEYQDTNHAQYKLIKLLAQKHRNICCVGDDDQSIYAFRGATIHNILSFEKDYPDATVIKLEQNYRSTKKILQAAYEVISKNSSRKEKKLWTENHEGEPITLYSAIDEKDEANFVIDKILELSKDYNLSDIAVLYRTNAQSRSLEEAFLKAGVPYKIVGGIRFYDRKEIKDILSYLKTIYNPKDESSLERAISTPKRGIGPKTFEELRKIAKLKKVSAGELLINNFNEITDQKLKNFGALLFDFTQKIKEFKLTEFIDYVIEKSGYLKLLKDGSIENETRIENLKELLSVAQVYDNIEGFSALSSFLEDVSLLEDIEQSQDNLNEDKVTLMTIHASKGLEFDVVFVTGVEENLFPHVNSIAEIKDLEEERRLAYVAITRAKHKLFFTHAKTRLYFGATQMNPVSRFIMDIDSQLLEKEGSIIEQNFVEDRSWGEYNQIDIKEGDKVAHEYFGKGEVIYIDNEIVRVDFGAVHGVKDLMVEYARLVKIS
ncbi:MAG: ATP-dependent DNA helicase PcrA [Candidatus Dojkabacteria bacterium]|nr:MAG: ATP-dependent DNA helicase PcrA [Candidatus Dojkabacteria bacterium]